MRTAILGILLFIAVDATCQTNMFLDNPSHVPVQKEYKNDCFGSLAWKFYAGAAIRSTPVSDNKNIYFGTEKGEFFSISLSGGKMNWKFTAPSAIHSSPAIHDGKVFFSDSKQTLFALSTSTGKIAWQFPLGQSKPYYWKFDFFHSSPTISGDSLYIGSSDGDLYCISTANGMLFWMHTVSAQIRCTPAVSYGNVYFGDMNGNFYAINTKTGHQTWKYETNGTRFINDSFGFDRKGIVSSPVIVRNNLVFGGRDGYMYNLDPLTGKPNWIFDFKVTWVLSTVATDGKAVYAGTSDGKFVNAIDLQSGKELWRTPTSLVWSSPLLINSKLYAGGYDGLLYCLDKRNGTRLINALCTRGKIQSSPVIAGNIMISASDDGYVYALTATGNCHPDGTSFIKYVYYDREAPRLYFRNGTDLWLRQNLANSGFRSIDSKGLEDIFKKEIPADSGIVVVMASNFFPQSTLKDGQQSLLRQFLNKGGRIVVTGLNPAVYDTDPETKDVRTDFQRMKSILDIDLRYNDSRAHGGVIYCQATKAGLDAGLNNWWMAPFPVTENQVDIVLGETEYKEASAYVKKYSPKNNSGLIQIWIDQDFIPTDIDFVRKVALASF